MHTGEIKECPTGVCWTGFFLGFFVLFWRGDIKWGICALAISLLSIPTGLPISIGVFGGIGAAYNMYYARELYQKGFRPIDEQGIQAINNILKKFNKKPSDYEQASPDPLDTPPENAVIDLPNNNDEIKHFCPNCGERVDTLLNFCPKCGKPIK